MAERYDTTAAAHYAAYRPPLHQLILRRALAEDAFVVGLDIGCGTGHSSIALAAYCQRVYGVDPSSAMLRQATTDPRVTYLEGAAERIPLPDRSVDVLTFAGSLFYADTEVAAAEVRRVCRGGGVIVTYDFELLLAELLRCIGIEPEAAGSDYDHRANLSGASGLQEEEVGRARVAVPVEATELAHLVLSDSTRFDRIASRYRTPDPFPALVRELRSLSDPPTVEADIHYSRYRFGSS
jgi:SAM-dependent methyltransferase